MSLIEWKPSFALGVPSVDAEHEALIGMINDVYARIEGAETAAPGTVGEVLGEIHAGIAGHFALEERLMREAGWYECAAHKADHEALLDAIRDLMDVHARDPEAGRARLRRELADWFGTHFRTFDARLHEAFGDGHAT